MIDFKNKDELPTSVVICGSLAAIVIAGGCLLFLPKPAAPSDAEDRAARKKVTKATDALKDEIKTAKQQISAETWPGNPEDVGPLALKQVNSLLQNRHLKLVGFHSQKPLEEPNITLIPFIVAVDGSFPNVMAFTRDLEKSGSKLAINLFQVSNADQSTDKVSASIGITAYQLPPAPATTSAPAVQPTTKKAVKKNA